MAGNTVIGLLRVLLSANTAEFDAAMKRSAESAKAWSKEFNSIGQQATKVGTALTKTLTLPLAALGIGSVKAAMDFESSFANIGKTVDGVSDKAGKLTKAGEALAKTFREMAKEIPATTDELNAIAALGGQMGVPIDQLAHFTRNVAALGVAVDGISTEEAAAGLAQIGNISGTGTTKIAEMASALVHLGNSSNATEGDILEFSKRLMGAGHAVGMTVPEVMALGTAMANVGINAEAGGTAMSTVISKISKAVSSGGAALEEFAKVAGMSADAFAGVWKRSPIEAIDLFVKGLSRMKGEGADLNLTMGEIGTEGIRVADTLKRLAGAGDGVSTSLKIANEGFIAGNKHLEEAEKKYATTANQLKVLWNQIRDVGITIGNALLPAIKSTIGMMQSVIPLVDGLANAFAILPGPIQAAIVGVGLLVAAAGPLIYLFGQLAIAAGAIVGAFAPTGIATTLLSSSWATLARVLGPIVSNVLPILLRGLLALTSPIGLVVSAVTALAAIWFKWGEDIKRIVSTVFGAVDRFFGGVFSDTLRKVKDIVSDLAESIGNLASIVKSTIIIAFYAAKNAALELWESLKEKLYPVAQLLGEIFKEMTGIALNQVVPAMKAIAGAVLSLIPGLTSTIGAIAWLRENTPGLAKSTGDVADVMKKLADAASGASDANRKLQESRAADAAATEFWAQAQRDAEKGLFASASATTQAGTATKTFASELAEARKQLAGMSKGDLADLTLAIQHNADSADKLAKRYNVSELAVKLLSDRMKEGVKVTKEAESAAEKHAKAIEKQRDALEKLGIITEQGANEALKELAEMHRLAEAGGADHDAVMMALLPKLKDLEEKAARSGVKVKGLAVALNEAEAGAHGFLDSLRAIVPLLPTTIGGIEGVGTQIQITSAEAAMAAQGAKLLTEAYHSFGLKTREELQQLAREAEENYRLIAAAVGRHAPEAIEAYRKMIEAQKAASMEVPSLWQTEILPSIIQAIDSISRGISDGFAKMLTGAESFADAFKGIWQSIKQSILNVFSEILDSFINGLLKGMIRALTGQNFSGGFGSLLAGAFGMGGGGGLPGLSLPLPTAPGIGGAAGGVGMFGLSPLLGGLLSGGAGFGLGLLGEQLFGEGFGGGAFGIGTGALTGLMLGGPLGALIGGVAGGVNWGINRARGGEEGMYVNPARDLFLSQFGGRGTGPESGFHQLGVRLQEAVGGPEADRLHRALREADTMKEYEAAVRAITAALEAHRAKTLETATAVEEAAQREQAARDKQIQSLTKQLDDLDTEYQSLADQVAKEAPEEVMGVVEAAQRARMAQIEGEREILHQELETIQQEAETAAIATAKRIAEILGGLHFTVKTDFEIPDMPSGGFEGHLPGWDTPDHLPSFASGTHGQYMDFGRGTLAVLHGREKITPEGGDMGGGVYPTTVIMEVDGRAFARAVVPTVPGEARRLGVRVRT